MATSVVPVAGTTVETSGRGRPARTGPGGRALDLTAPAGSPGGPAPGPAGPARRRWPGALAALVLYAVGAWALYGFASWAPAGRIDICNCSDQVQEVWFLAWPAYALAHGQSILASTWMVWPHGFNMMDNTSMPALGVVAAPVTWLAGPVATYNLLLHLGPTLSAFAMYVVVRRWAPWWPAAFLGGAAFGFSTFMIGQSQGHVFLTFSPLVPILLLLVDEAVVRRRRSPVLLGSAIGAVAALELLVSSEVLAMAVVVAVVGLAVLAVARRRQVRAALPSLARVAAAALVVGGILAAVPIWYLVHGPQHVVGPPHPLRDLTGIPGDALGAVVPTSFFRLAPASWVHLGDRLTSGDLVENGEYLGIPLVAALVALTVAFRRRRALLYFTFMAAVSWVLSLGAHLVVGGRATGIPLPGLVLVHLPLVQDIAPVRFTLLEWLCAAAALAIGLDELHRALSGRLHAAARRHVAPFAAAAVPLALGVAVAVPLVPDSRMFATVPAPVPSLFTTRAVRAIPAGSVVLDYPYPADGTVQGMLDQAVAGFRYKIVGGYAFVPGAGGRSAWVPVGSMFPPLWQVFVDSFHGGAQLGAVPPLTAATVRSLRAALTTAHIGTVVVQPVGADPERVVRYLTAALGPPTHVGGVTEWFDVPARLALSRPPPA